MRSPFVFVGVVGEFGGVKREIVDAAIDGDAVEVRHPESRRHAAVMPLPVNKSNQIPILDTAVVPLWAPIQDLRSYSFSSSFIFHIP